MFHKTAGPLCYAVRVVLQIAVKYFCTLDMFVKRAEHSATCCNKSVIFNVAVIFGRTFELLKVKKGKAIPLQAWRGPECSRRSRLPDFKTIDT